MTIKHSEELNHLFSALSKFQGRVEQAKKDQSGYKNNYKFADLSQYFDLSQNLLAEHELCVLQMPGSMEIVEITKEIYDATTKTYDYPIIKVPKQNITTWIGHSSGQFISAPMEILVEKLAGMSWGQSTGSAITYGRRYSRAGSIGMTEEDNDNQNKNTNYINNRPPSIPTPKVTNLMIDDLRNILMEDPARLEKILQYYKVKIINDLTVDQYEFIVKKIKYDLQKSDDTLISTQQANFIKTLVTSEELVQILKDHKLTRLEEMNTYYFNILNEQLKKQIITNSKKENETIAA